MSQPIRQNTMIPNLLIHEDRSPMDKIVEGHHFQSNRGNKKLKPQGSKQPYSPQDICSHFIKIKERSKRKAFNPSLIRKEVKELQNHNKATQVFATLENLIRSYYEMTFQR